MAMLTAHRDHGVPPTAVILRLAIIVLTLATAAIHVSLGGTMFLLNALGYAAFTVAMVLPGPARRFRWLVRYGLIAFTAATIGGWLAFGARFDLAYIDKAIEVALIGALLVESWTTDGGPLAVARRVHRLATGALR
jgi:hypothetical protein